MKRFVRGIFIWLGRLSAVIMAVCLAMLMTDSIINVKTSKGQYQYLATPVQRQETPFEDTGLFHDIFKEQIEEMVRVSVIRNQLETDGSYDPKKQIDITAYANRANVKLSDEEEVTAYYYLDDLINWGNYGFDFQTVNTIYGEKKILVSRYKSVEGKDLSYYAENDEEYEYLIENLEQTAQNLFQNYTEYMKYNEQYVEGDTNLFYCFKLVGNEEVSYYTNVDKDFSEMTADDISEYFSKYSKFLNYNPDKMQLVSNTDLNAKELRDILNPYEYSFQDNSRVYIALNDAYPFADDLKNAKEKYEYEVNSFKPTTVVLFVFLFVWILCFGLLTVKEGKGNIKKNYKADRMFLEIYVVLIAAFIIGGFLISNYVLKTISIMNIPQYQIVLISGVLGFVLNVIFFWLYLCGLRKLRDKTLFKNSLVLKISKAIVDGVVETYENGELVVRIWIPYFLFLMINLILVLLGIGGVIAALFFDIGVGIFMYNSSKERQKIIDGINNLHEGNFDRKIETTSLHGDNLDLAKSVNGIGSSIKRAVETSMKDEKMKADLITNVSHDIKTPLTSIINYVDLLKREKIQDEKIAGYIEVLDAKSQRLKQLTDDLVEVSKITSGNISMEMQEFNLIALLQQCYGEFLDKFEENNLEFVQQFPEEAVYIEADTRHLYRVLENLYNNVCKYALKDTRVYIQVETLEDGDVCVSLKNISSQPLGISADELTERFIRGDVSRKTEGSGLGLSIAKNLTNAMGGEFNVVLDGDLFKVVMIFHKAQQ